VEFSTEVFDTEKRRISPRHLPAMVSGNILMNSDINHPIMQRQLV